MKFRKRSEVLGKSEVFCSAKSEVCLRQVVAEIYMRAGQDHAPTRRRNKIKVTHKNKRFLRRGESCLSLVLI